MTQLQPPGTQVATWLVNAPSVPDSKPPVRTAQTVAVDVGVLVFTPAVLVAVEVEVLVDVGVRVGMGVEQPERVATSTMLLSPELPL